MAKRDIEAGTTLFTIPRKAIMSRETSELASRLPDLFAASVSAQQHDEAEDEVPEQKQDSWSALILILMHELLRGDASPWRAYFDVLPTAFDTPMFWGDDELAELQASATRGKVGRESAEAMFRAAVVPVIRRHADLFPGSAGVSDDELIALAHRMGSTIMAYAFDLEGDDDEEEPEGDDEWVEDRQGKSTMGMVPMADILNADAEFNVAHTQRSQHPI